MNASTLGEFVARRSMGRRWAERYASAVGGAQYRLAVASEASRVLARRANALARERPMLVLGTAFGAGLALGLALAMLANGRDEAGRS